MKLPSTQVSAHLGAYRGQAQRTQSTGRPRVSRRQRTLAIPLTSRDLNVSGPPLTRALRVRPVYTSFGSEASLVDSRH